MNEREKRLVALGSSAAVNCRPCLEHHGSLAGQEGLTGEDIAAAIEVGLGVSDGARRQTKKFAADLVGAPVPAAAAAGSGSGCC